MSMSYVTVCLQCFQYPGYFRVVLTVPADKVDEACDRIEQFCRDHYCKPVENSMDINGKS